MTDTYPEDREVILGRAPDGSVIRGEAPCPFCGEAHDFIVQGDCPQDARAGGLTRYDDPLDDLPTVTDVLPGTPEWAESERALVQQREAEYRPDLDPWYSECPDCGHGHTAMTTPADCGPTDGDRCPGCADLLGLRGWIDDGNR